MKKIIVLMSLSLISYCAEITDSQVKQFVNIMAKELPIKVNKNFSTLSVIKIDKTITFNNQIYLMNLTQDMIKNKKDIFDKEWCSDELLVFLKAGYLIENLYYDNENNLLATNITSYNDCLFTNTKTKYLNYLKTLTDDEAKYYYQNANNTKFEFERKARSIDININDDDLK